MPRLLDDGRSTEGGDIVKKLLLFCTVALMPGMSLAATPMEGVIPEVRRGFFVETDIGVFFTLGGNDVYSNAQTYLQLGLGYDINENIELGAHFGLGASAANCFAVRDASGNCVADGASVSENFTVSFIDVSAAYLFKLVDRVYLSPKLLAGYSLLDPAPVVDANGLGVTGGANLGAGVGVEYATSMDHFTVGADLTFRFVVGPNIPAFAVFPRVKYTF